jgi:hypothetical protein
MNMWAILMLLSGGLFTGGVTVIAWERVRVWHALPLPQFRPEFAATIDVADRVQPALLVASIVSTVGFAITASGTARWLALTGAAGLLATLIVSVAVLVPLQHRIIASSGEEDGAVEAMRRRWLRGHLERSVLAVASFILVAMAVAV